MKILIACERSQEVCKAFRAQEHESYSCDIENCYGGAPQWHIQCDIRDILYDSWDMIIAHPPCTHTAVSGARWFPEKIADGRQQAAIDFFMMFVERFEKDKRMRGKIRGCIEHPISIMSTRYRKPDQIIQPWQYGHGEVKATCLWLFNLPKLKPTHIVPGREPRLHNLSPSKNRAIIRSKTYPGIAKAMAKQWNNFNGRKNVRCK